MTNDEWITTAEAVALSNYDIQHLRFLIRQGKIEGRKFGPVWQVRKQSLVAYMEAAERSHDKRRGPKQ